MTENEKIQTLIDRYESIFSGTDMDISQSIKGKWYFSRYNSQYNYYDCFREFDTAEELVKIILGELAFDMHYAIDGMGDAELPEYVHENLSDILQHANDDYTDMIELLWEKLQKLS